MTASIQHRLDGRWHIEISPESDSEMSLFLALSASAKMSARFLGALLIVERETPEIPK